MALAFPRELLAAASRELELANACRLYRRRGAVTGAVTSGGDTNRPQVGTPRGSPNASTLAAARRMATGPGHEALVAAAPTPELTNVEWTGEMDTAILMAASRGGANASTWATLVLPRGPCAGTTNAQVAARFAETLAAVRAAGAFFNAKFSILHPGTEILPHCGPSNARLRAHVTVAAAASQPPVCFQAPRPFPWQVHGKRALQLLRR